jgi:5-methylcytosine-specific restriction endonuclease McrA
VPTAVRPAPVRRVVRQRDGSQCTFVNRTGGRCTERRGLEFHHRHPYGRGGVHTPENVCLMCREHNAYLAELEYGKEQMAKFRRHPDRVSEDSPYYVVGAPLAKFALHGPTRAPDT